MASSSMPGLLSARYPLDDPSLSVLGNLLHAPYPPHPPYPLFARLVPKNIYPIPLNPLFPLLFSLTYYLAVHYANRWVAAGSSSSPSSPSSKPAAPKDWTKNSRALRYAIILHNLALAAYSAWTFVMMATLVADFFAQGWRAAGVEGLKLAICSMPTNEINLGRYAYLFYLSKYYEVVDSLILLLKGKQVGQLQSYHHAGAIIAMWVAVRYQSQPVWVFCVFNSFVHTLMYSYYLCAAMHWPFPKVLKRSLTTLQILQIASGTLLTNLYWFLTLHPALVSSGYLSHRVSAFFPGKRTSVAMYANARLATSDPQTCLQSSGAAFALHVNTAYMTPLLILFFRFFAKSYLSAVSKSSKSTKSKSKSKSKPSSSENPSSSVSEKTSTSSSTATATAASSAAQRAATLAVSGEDAARLVVGEKEGDGVLNGSGNGNGNGNGIGIGRASANGKVSIVNGNGNGNGSAGERKKER